MFIKRIISIMYICLHLFSIFLQICFSISVFYMCHLLALLICDSFLANKLAELINRQAMWNLNSVNNSCIHYNCFHCVIKPGGGFDNTGGMPMKLKSSIVKEALLGLCIFNETVTHLYS